MGAGQQPDIETEENMDYKKIMKKAKKTNNMREATEADSPFQGDRDGTVESRIRTIMCALDAGMRINTFDDNRRAGAWDCIAEALDMAGRLHTDMNGGDFLGNLTKIERD